jgi:exopolyphosphatase/guanosine-5'-triphosphate,3'-diphosphate pyrophosphatase
VSSVPVEQRSGKTTAIHALKQLPLGQTFAAIDLGSSSGKMLVGKVTATGVQIVVDHKIGCALGRDVDAGQAIPAANMDRAIDALKAFVALASQHGVDVAGIPLITTAVVRNAPNGADFVARVQREVGLAARILSGVEEADVGFRGALGALLQTPGRYATIDLGGGSFQLAVGTEQGLEQGGSTQVGSNTILDDLINPRVGSDGVVSADVFALVDETLAKTAPLPLPRDAIEGRTLVATGGVSKFLRVHLGKDVVRRDEIDALRRQLGALSIPDRAAFVSAGRSDDEKAALGIGTSPGAQDYGKKLPASLSLLLHIVDGLGLDEVRISSTDARHALLQTAVATAR